MMAQQYFCVKNVKEYTMPIYSGHRKSPTPFKMFTFCCLTASNENTKCNFFSPQLYVQNSKPQYPSEKNPPQMIYNSNIKIPYLDK